MKTHQEALSDLLLCRVPVGETVQAIRQFPWDSEAALTVLTRLHVTSILDRYLRGELSATQLEEWANAIEGREDIDFEPNHENDLQAIIHQLANPLLTKPITPETAQELLDAILH